MQMAIMFIKQPGIKAVMRLKIYFTMTTVVVVDMTPQGAICCDHSLFRAEWFKLGPNCQRIMNQDCTIAVAYIKLPVCLAILGLFFTSHQNSKTWEIELDIK